MVVSEGKFLRFMKQGSWEYVSRKGVTGVVTIIAVTREKKLVLVEQYRPPVESRVIELPAGLANTATKHWNPPPVASCWKRRDTRRRRCPTSAAAAPRRG